MSDVKSVKGGDWDYGAIGNATWTGVLLSDVLKTLGLTSDSELAQSTVLLSVVSAIVHLEQLFAMFSSRVSITTLTRIMAPPFRSRKLWMCARMKCTLLSINCNEFLAVETSYWRTR